MSPERFRALYPALRSTPAEPAAPGFPPAARCRRCGNGSFAGAVDGLQINDTVYDFEPSGVRRTIPRPL